MFDLSIWEIAVIGVVAIMVIGPNELPRALMTAGKWLRKFREVTGSLRSGLNDMIRETEVNQLENDWADQNKKIMSDYPDEMLPLESQLNASDNDIEQGDDVSDLSDVEKKKKSGK